uniref:CobW C-terminal domain-containing protein n=1 Tax=Vitis vinifera TaxID=29760 RepID=A5BQZ4_VITVI|nr:hypothetical protein VITISV_002002 [Vitis vinifera]
MALILVMIVMSDIDVFNIGHAEHNDHHSYDHTHDPGVSLVSIVCEGSLDLEKANIWLGTLLLERSEDIYRMKGLLSVQGMDERFVFQDYLILFYKITTSLIPFFYTILLFVNMEGLANLESINLSFTAVTDSGLRKSSALSSLKSLNLDAHQITDAGLAALTSLTGLTHLDLFGARITDSGTSYLRNFKNLQSLEICGGGLTDAGVKNIKDLTCLTVLNLSQNCNLTDKSLELISGLTALVSLSVSNSRITNAGLQHLKQLKNLKSLTLDSCKVTVNDIKKLQSKDLPNLPAFAACSRWS